MTDTTFVNSQTVITSPWAQDINDSVYRLPNIAGLRAKVTTGPSKWFVSGYYSAGDGGGGWYYYDSADTTSVDNGGTIIVASDGGRWKLLSTQDHLNVKQFGAKGDGVANDASAIQAAITASVGGKIYFPHGHYLVGTSLSVTSKDNLTFIGDGGTYFSVTQSSHIEFTGITGSLFDVQQCLSVQWENLYLSGPNTTDGIKVHGGVLQNRWSSINNCLFEGFNRGTVLGDNTAEAITTNLAFFEIKFAFYRNCIRGIFIDAQGFDGLRLDNVWINDAATNITLSGVHVVTGASVNIVAKNVYMNAGSVMQYGWYIGAAIPLTIEQSRVESSVTNTIFVGLYEGSSLASNPTLLNNFSVVHGTAQVSPVSIQSGNNRGMLIDGGYFTGDINIGVGVQTIAKQIRFLAPATYTGTVNNQLVEWTLNSLHFTSTAGSVPIQFGGMLLADNGGNNGYAAKTAGGVITNLLRMNTADQCTINANSKALAFENTSTQTTVGAAGGASALPATPSGYWRISVNGGVSVVKIPYYTDV